MASFEHPHPDGLPRAPTYSQVVVATGTRLIHVSGQVSVDAEGGLVGAGDLAAQTAQAMRNLGLALKAAGADYADIVKMTTYVVNYRPEYRAVIREARSGLFGGEPPASTLIGVAALALPEWLIEIDAVAVTG